MAPCPHMGTRGGDDCSDPGLIPNASSPLLSPDPGNLLLPWIRPRPGVGARGDRTPLEQTVPHLTTPARWGDTTLSRPVPSCLPAPPQDPQKRSQELHVHPTLDASKPKPPTHSRIGGAWIRGDPPKLCHPLRLPQPPQDGDMRGGGIAHWTPFSSASPSLVFPWSSGALPGMPGRRGAQSGIGAKTSWFGAN